MKTFEIKVEKKITGWYSVTAETEDEARAKVEDIYDEQDPQWAELDYKILKVQAN